jgi:hypothetical protein
MERHWICSPFQKNKSHPTVCICVYIMCIVTHVYSHTHMCIAHVAICVYSSSYLYLFM